MLKHVAALALVGLLSQRKINYLISEGVYVCMYVCIYIYIYIYTHVQCRLYFIDMVV